MWKRLAVVLLLPMILVALAAGCASSSGRTGTSQATGRKAAPPRTETATAATSSSSIGRIGTFESYETSTAIATSENTGGALVLLDSGTLVYAKCPIKGLMRGDPVSLQQYPDAVWIVTGKP